MSQIEQILARSRSPGQFVESGRFTLAREKAVEKLREYSLRDKRQYIVELVQCGVLAGATYLAVDVDESKALVAWVGGRAFDQDELGRLFDYLFTANAQGSDRALVQLAIAVNAVMQRKPRVMRIESGDGTPQGTVRVDLDRKGHGTAGTPVDPLPGTYIYAEFGRFDELVRRFTGDLAIDEALLVEERCVYSPIPILVNARAPFGYSPFERFEAVHGGVAFDADRRRGVVEPGHGGFSIVIGGTVVTSLPLPELGAIPHEIRDDKPLRGVICDDSLRKTADQSDIVRDHRFMAMLAAVQPHATEVVRRHSRGLSYTPPVLPELPAEVPTSKDAPIQPLADEAVVNGVGARPPFTVAALKQLREEFPTFWVTPDDLPGVEAALDCARFPHPVLVLAPGAMTRLLQAAPELTVHRLTSVVDADFAARTIDRRRHTRQLHQRFRADAVGGLEGDLLLELVTHGRTRFGPMEPGDVWVLVVHDDRTQRCLRLPLGLPGLAVRLTLVARAEDAVLDDPRLAQALSRAILEAAWQLAEEAIGDPEAVGFVAGVLAAHLRIHLHHDDDGRTQIDVALPSHWGAVAEALLDANLLRQGTLSLRGLTGLLGSWDVARVDGRAHHLRFLEERLGFGHIARQDDIAQPVAIVALVDGGWVPLQSWADVEHAEPDACLWLGRHIGAAAPDSLQLLSTRAPQPLFGAAVSPTAAANPDWEPGLAELEVQLAVADADAEDPASYAGLTRLARITLAARRGCLDEHALFVGTDGPMVPTDQVRVLPHAGPSLDEPNLLHATLDQVRILESAWRLPVPLRLDDPAAVWSADPDPAHWLVMSEVSLPGVRGWIGLRHPHDRTGGVLVQASGALVGLDLHHLPCHGWLSLQGGAEALDEGERALLAARVDDLYRALATTLQGKDAERKEHARRYAMELAAATGEPGAPLSGTAAMLAPLVQVEEGGNAWGDLDRWWRTAADRRPDLALPERGAPAQHSLQDALSETSLAKVLRDRLTRVTEAQLIGIPVWVAGDWGKGKRAAELDSRKSSLDFTVDYAHPLVVAALDGNTVATEMLLLEMLRLIRDWDRRYGTRFDLVDAQRVLVGQRLVG